VQVPGILINLLWRLWPPFVISIALGLPLLNARALAFEQYAIGNQGSQGKPQTDLRSASTLKSDDNFKAVVDTSMLKFDDKFKAVVETIKTSQKASFGSLSVTKSYTNSNTRTGVGPAAEGRHDLAIAFDLADFRKGAGEMLPSAIWASSFVKQASYYTTPVTTLLEGPPDRTTGSSVGATWAWSSGNVGVTYWNYQFNSLHFGDDYNSVGHGFDATISAYVDTLGFYAKLSYHQGGDLSFNQAQDLVSFYRSAARGYDAYLSVFYKPQSLPDIVVDGSFGRYQSNSFGFADDGRYWSATLGFDFSKFLWKPVEIKSSFSKDGILAGARSAKLVYRYSNQTYHSFGATTANDNHFLGMILRATLN
jgi:hypothetical protein